MPEIKIVDLKTGKETIREMNEKELAQMELDAANAQAQAEAKAASLSKLEALGLTAEDLRAILG